MSSTSAERRRTPRIRLHVPMFVRGVDAYGEDFLDLTKTLNISSTGAYLASARALKTNELVSLTIPAPPPTSSGVIPTPEGPIQARVRRMRAAGDVHLIGVEFLKPLD
ncbi:MAG: PilZ domain-containing protein [Acidobacteria bacterium]|nr:PilZ domain-containing protein [Acidobacteriota bacterium]